MRVYNMIAITAAGSCHMRGTLSIMDIAAALYLKHINMTRLILHGRIEIESSDQ
jgi:transketolase N-terminal domain/subunit